ncbi:MAG: TGS domain-containing protein [Firmicutes bacterium]|nr:TGS domain-containing protein [Bacillota bacterium]
MPANLTPQYLQAEQRYKTAKTVEDKIAALEEMLAVIPKHKGTEKIQADIKRRLSKLRTEGAQKSKMARYDPYRIPKEGAGQAVLVGFPNTGKSSLVGALTKAKVCVADYPFSTTVPVAGMMPFEDVSVQLVDTPPITGDEAAPGLVNLLRQADMILLAVDGSAETCLEQVEHSLNLLHQKKAGSPEKPCLLLVTKTDLEAARENLELIGEYVQDHLPLLPVSVFEAGRLEELRRRIFEALNIIRIYSKVPGRPPDLEAPFVLKKGSTVLDFARAIHRDFPQRLKSARVWGSARFPGQSVLRDYVLQDKDIVELHV